MLKPQFTFVWLCWLVVGSYGSLVPFIDKCVWNDKACLLQSSNKALPHICVGLPELGVPPLDPIVLDHAKVQESDLDLVFTNLKLTGTCNCKIVNVERDVEKGYILVQLECPISVHGTYKASGSLLSIPLSGNGPFRVETKKVFISVKISVNTVDGSDGQKFWNFSKYDYMYDFKEKAVMKFENLYDGDKEKAAPIINILDQSWKELLNLFGKPIINKLCEHVMHSLKGLMRKVPISDLEIL